MLTVAETEVISRYAIDYWTEDEREAFAVWIAENYNAGDVVRGSGGCRKIRRAHKGIGKSGGVRVIYYNMLEGETIWLLFLFLQKTRTRIFAAHILKAIKEEITCL